MATLCTIGTGRTWSVPFRNRIAATAAASYSPASVPASATPAVHAFAALGMLPVEATFWNQLTGNLDSGFSYTSGDTQTQFSASGTLAYTAERYTLGLNGSSNLQRPGGRHQYDT